MVKYGKKQNTKHKQTTDEKPMKNINIFFFYIHKTEKLNDLSEIILFLLLYN